MKRNQWARLVVTDGTETFDLLTLPICLKDWEPAIAQKREIRKQSFQADGSIPVDYSWDNINDVFVLNMKGKDTDALARLLQDLHRLLLKGLAYWATSWQKEPVWIEARAQNETNIRCAHIVSFQTEKDNNPFAQSFFSSKPFRREFDLGIEHKHWAANAPGVGPCVEISGAQDWAMSYPLFYNGTDQEITVPAAASLNDLPDNAVAGKGQITVHGWIRADGYGEDNFGRIAVKGDNTTLVRGWHFLVSSTNGLQAVVNCATQDAVSRAGLDEFTADGLRHHVLMTYSETGAGLPAARTIYLAIGGIWIASYPTQQVSIGNYAVDNADDMVIGNNVGTTATFDGEIGWMEVNSGILYSPAGGDFTPEARCPLPFPDTAAQFLGIYEGDGTAIRDFGPNVNSGTAANDEWGDGCELTFGRAETCEDEVYIANKHNVAQLSHVYIWDATLAAFGANLLGAALPYNLLPAAPANGDIIYFGSDTALPNSGPFCSLVFDIETAATYGAGDSLDWEIWTGAWVALTVQDNTDDDGTMGGSAFDTNGVKSVHWIQPSGWAAIAINGITAFWVRAVLTEVTGVTTPTQQNRNVYSILWPHVDIASDQVLGDIEALARTVLKNQSDRSQGINEPSLYSNRVLIAIRSIDRGDDFTPYINLSDEQNNSGITINLAITAPDAAFTDNVETPTGRQITLTNPANGWNNDILITFDETLGKEYRGRFHAFLRGEQKTAGDIDLRLRSRLGRVSGYSRLAKNVVTFGVVGTDDIVMDFGEITIPPTSVIDDSEEVTYTSLVIEVDGDGAADCNLYDLILVPVDEWVGDYRDIDHLDSWSGRGTALAQAKLDVDGIMFPRKTKRALLRYDPAGSINDIYKSKATTPILQSNTDQRVWFFIIKSNMSATGYNLSWHEVSGSVLEYSNARYLSARGDR